jgi:inosine-uridine nucleoside N-ribohydrolase
MIRKKIIIDTDPGVDDAMAIQLAINSDEFEILGLTTVFGNVSVELATINALRLIHIADQNIPVAIGAADPLKGEFMGGVPFVHGNDGQGNTWHKKSPLIPVELSAAEFIVQQILKYPKQVTLIAIGPLTNLALALELNPSIAERVQEVIMMGGNAFCPGNATPAAEANIFSDPDAADIVFGANWPVTMVGLDVTHKVFMHNSVLEKIAENKTPLNKYVASTFPFYRDFFVKTNKIEGIFVHDSSAIMFCLDPTLFKTIQCPVRVEAHDCISKGKSWPLSGDSDQESEELLKPWHGRPDINICVEVNGDAVIERITQRLTKQY